VILMARILLVAGFAAVLWVLFKFISALAFGLAEILARAM
jgi:hypothetical protein